MNWHCNSYNNTKGVHFNTILIYEVVYLCETKSLEYAQSMYQLLIDEFYNLNRFHSALD